MGGFQQWRDFLLALFFECFEELWENGRCVDVLMVDLMQYLAPRVLDSRHTFDSSSVTRRIEEVVTYHQNSADDPSRPIIAKGDASGPGYGPGSGPGSLVVMLDTIHNVPKNKAGEQKSRSSRSAAVGTTIPEIVELPHMNQTLFDKMKQMASPILSPTGTDTSTGDVNMFIINNSQSFKYPLEGTTVWRSVNLKLQLYRLITFHLLHIPVAKGKMLVIDDGLAFSLPEYERVREDMIRDFGYEGRSEFEKDWLVNQFIIHSRNGPDGKPGATDFITRFVKYEEGDPVKWPSTGIGEADIKIQHYITRESGKKRFLVVNQDSDVIFILLLHMHTLLRGDESDDEYEVWLDTKAPSDGDKTRPYRYINIKKLYWAIINLFKKEYPGVEHPIETFCFVVFSLKTDFSRPFHSCLGITERVVWDTFSELHSQGGGESFIKFSKKRGGERSSTRVWHDSLYGLLNNAVSYNPGDLQYTLNHDAIKRFYYLLCQHRLLTIRKDLRLTNGFYDIGSRKRSIEPDELLIYARDVSERLELFLKRMGDKEKNTQHTMDEYFNLCAKRKQLTAAAQSKSITQDVAMVEQEEKRYKPSSSLDRKKEAQSYVPVWIKKKVKKEVEEEDAATDEVNEEKEMEEIVEEENVMKLEVRREQSVKLDLKSYVIQNEDRLKKYVKKDPPALYFGIPTVNDMMAYIYKREWYIGYCTNGYRANGASALKYTECARQDKSLSLWGWKEVDVPKEEIPQVMNSSYYVTRYAPDVATGTVFKMTEVVETSEVYHRR